MVAPAPLAPTYLTGEIAYDKMMIILSNRPTRRCNLESETLRFLKGRRLACSSRKNVSMFISFMKSEGLIATSNNGLIHSKGNMLSAKSLNIGLMYREWCNKSKKEAAKNKAAKTSITAKKRTSPTPKTSAIVHRTIHINNMTVSGTSQDLASILKRMIQ